MSATVQTEVTLSTTEQAIANAVVKARTDIIAPFGKGTLVITPFQQELFTLAYKGAEAINKATESNRAAMRRALLDQYGSVCPTFEQFRADRAALKILAEQKGLVDDQWVRKPYNAAIVDLYGALPESQSEAAIAKRAARDAAGTSIKAKGGKDKPGAKAGEVAQRDPSASEGIEQYIAKHGLANVLAACSKILATERKDKVYAASIEAIARKYATSEAMLKAVGAKPVGSKAA